MTRKLREQTIREGINTEGATNFARDLYNTPDEVKLNWWEFFSNYRTKKWKQELKEIIENTGITFEDICDYIDIEYSSRPGFYKKLPKNRRTYIGIGMACKLPLETINRWIVKYGGKRKLYVKDVLNDLVWIYLINANYQNNGSTNYYKQYNKCQEEIERIFWMLDNEAGENDADTEVVENQVRDIVFDSEYNALKKYVKENISVFASAYAKPKKFLTQYVDQILRVKNENRQGRKWTLNTMRGYLDDSMINYLTSGVKYVPRSKRTHIAIALALGMTTDDISRYMDLLGYAHLDGTNNDEGILMNLLDKWEEAHHLQRQFKNTYIYGSEKTHMQITEQQQAVNEMLELRSEIREMYKAFQKNSPDKDMIKKFPYMND